MVLTHVNEFACTLHALECRFNYRFRTSYEGYHGTVCGFSRIDVKDLDAARLLD